MIIKVEKAAVNSRKVIDYNEKKIRCGKAEYVVSDAKEKLEEILRLEQNPFIRPNAGNLSFHMTVDCLPDEGVNDSNIGAIVSEEMAAIGMKDQPYVIYKHKDIVRVHYHVVSTKVKKDGHIVKLKHFRELNKAMKKYAADNGLPLKKMETIDMDEDEAIFQFSRKEAKGAQINFAVDIANKFNYGGELELAAILRTMRIGVMVSSKKKEECFLFTGLDKKGVSNTHLYSHLDPQGAILNKARNREHTLSEAGYAELGLTIDDLLDEANSYDDFRSLMEERGIYLINMAELKVKAKTSNPEFVLIDRFTHTIANEMELKNTLGQVKFALLTEPFLWHDKDSLLAENAKIEREFARQTKQYSGLKR